MTGRAIRKSPQRSEVLALPGRATPVGLVLRDGLSYHAWEAVGMRLRLMEQAVGWWIGDWLEYGERAYGEKYAQAVDGTQAHTWAQYAYVSRRFQISTRVEILPWSVHRELAGVENDDARHELLKQAAEAEWTVSQARAAIRDFRRTSAPPLPEGTFGVIYADPPWRFDNSGFEQSAESIYPTLDVDAICTLPIADRLAPAASLFLWVPNALLPDGLRVSEAWGFDYKTNRVWVKDRAPGIGWYVRSKHELLLIATRGDGMTPASMPDSWFTGPVTEHSRKPDRVYVDIEAMYPGPYLELFARHERTGWAAWGNELRASA